MGVGDSRPEPFAHGYSGHDNVRAGHGSRISDIKPDRSVSEMIGNISEELPLANENRNHISMCQARQQRKKFVANAVAQECRVTVGRVMERFDAGERADRLGVVPAQFNNGMARARTDTCESIGTCSAQQIHEHRLSPIIGGMPKRGIRSEDFETSGTCPSLKVCAGRNMHCFGPESRPESVRHGTNQRCFAIRPRPQAMINMHRSHLAASSHRQQQ
jgi:hypothetical protein